MNVLHDEKKKDAKTKKRYIVSAKLPKKPIHKKEHHYLKNRNLETDYKEV